MSRYAEGTEVSADKSRTEIERTLQRYGATGFMYGWQGSRAVIGFELKGRRYRLVLPLPDKNDRKFTHHSRGWRTPEAALKAWEQGTRQRWRALALVIKAKLEAVECGISTVEEEFLAHVVLPSGMSVGEWMAPQIESTYKTGKMPPLLPLLPEEEGEG